MYGAGPFAPTDRGAALANLRAGARSSGHSVSIPLPPSSGYAVPPRQHGPAMSAPPSQPHYAPYAPPPPSSSYGAPYQPQQPQADLNAMFSSLNVQTNAGLDELRQRTAEMVARMHAQQQVQQAGLMNTYEQRYTPSYHLENQQAQAQQQQRRAYGAAAMESALARKTGYSPPPQQQQYPYGYGVPGQTTPPAQYYVANPLGGTAPVSYGPPQHRHTPSTTSTGSTGSSVLGTAGVMRSPSGPTVVLSRPGEAAYVSPTPSPSKSALVVAHARNESDGSSSGSGSGSESFDSLATTVSGKATPPLRLNPGAAEWSPPAPTLKAVSPISTPFGLRSPPQSGSAVRKPLQLAQRGRTVLGVSAVRQPRGAISPDDAEYEQANFQARKRSHAQSGLALLTRRLNSPSPDDSLERQQQQFFAQQQQTVY